MRDPRDRGKRLGLASAGVILLVLASATVYWGLGDGMWSFSDCLYMTLVALSTVGFREVLPVDQIPGAKAFTMFLLVVGIGTVAYFLSAITAFIVEGDLNQLIERRRMDRRIKKLSGHIILLGVGRTGENSAAHFVKGGTPVVLVDQSAEAIHAFRLQVGANVPYVLGDATNERTLLEAGVERARGMISSMDSDQANLYATLTARQLNPDLRIVARASDAAAAQKLRLVGANRTVALAEIGGLRMFAEMERPVATNFLEAMLASHGEGMHARSFALSESSTLVGKTLAQADLRSHAGDVLVLAWGELDSNDYHPVRPDLELRPGLTLIVMGRQSSLDIVEQLV